MKFGYFDDKNKEYVITRPDTPLPWINYLGNDNFFSLISNTAGGYSFYKDAKLRRLTRYRYNNVPKDLDGRHFYIADEEGNRFSPTFLPLKTNLDKYECHHGLGYTEFVSSKSNIETKLTFFVPLSDNCEIAKLVVKNTSSKKKTLNIISQIEFCLYNAQDDMSNFQRNFSTGEVEVENGVIYHKTEYRERRNHYTFYSVNSNPVSFETDRDTFLGKFNDYTSPDALNRANLSNSLASGWSPIAAFQNILELQPGEEKVLIYILGYVEVEEEKKFIKTNVINKENALKIVKKYNEDNVNKSLKEVKNFWDSLLSNLQIKSQEPKFDRMVNIWNQYQCVITYRMSRSASYYESGIGRGMGFRDSCQDLFGFVHMIPALARQRILDIAAIQKEDGSTWHQYQPLTKRGNADVGGGFNDDPLWLVSSTYFYLCETGDFSILDEMVPFNNDETKSKTLLEHLECSINYTLNNIGPHKLPLIGRADWNDCLNLNCFSKDPSESFQTCSNFESGKAESTFIGALFVYAAKQYVKILNKLLKNDEANKISLEISKMEKAMETVGWDGKWFLRAYDAFENKVGSNECEDGKIFIEPQGFAVMAGIGIESGKATTALNSVKEKLDTKYGIVLLQPAYKTYHLELGEVSSYPPGYKENAGIFCHNNPWVSCAEAVLGHADRAYEIYKKICPSYLEELSEIHKTEPYVYSQMVAGIDAKNFGEAKNSWLTGTASWTFVNVSHYLLGIVPTLDGLSFVPCLPKEIGDISIIRKFRGVEYHINYKQTGSYSLTIDGKKEKGNIVPFSKDKSIVKVEVTY